jgi:hypothetical protein
LGDNGDNSATIILTDGNWGSLDGENINNRFLSCGLKYSTDNITYTPLTNTSATPQWKIYIPYGTTQIFFKDIYSAGEHGNVPGVVGN